MVNRNKKSYIANFFHMSPADALMYCERIWIRNERLKNTTSLLEFHSIEMSKFLLRFEFNNTNLIISQWGPGK